MRQLMVASPQMKDGEYEGCAALHPQGTGHRGLRRVQSIRARIAVAPLALMLFFAAGCNTVIFYAAFDDPLAYYAPGVPEGAPPGEPLDDIILLGTKTQHIKLIQDVVTFDAPLLGQFIWQEIHAYFYSHPVVNTQTEKMVTWSGQLKAGSAPMVFAISAATKFTKEPDYAFGMVRVFADYIDFPLDHADPTKRLDISPHVWHTARLTVNPVSGTYSFEVEYSGVTGGAKGPLDPAVVSRLLDHPRLLVSAGLAGYAMPNDQYVLDHLIMYDYD